MTLTFIRHGLCKEIREGRFGADGPLDRSSTPHISMGDNRLTLCTPTRICGDSATALQLDAQPQQGLSPADYGDWKGLTLEDVPSNALLEWRWDPAFKGHGGESITELIERTREWLVSIPSDKGAIVVTHAENIRAALVAVSGSIEDYWTGDHCALRPFETFDLNL